MDGDKMAASNHADRVVETRLEALQSIGRFQRYEKQRPLHITLHILHNITGLATLLMPPTTCQTETSRSIKLMTTQTRKLPIFKEANSNFPFLCSKLSFFFFFFNLR